jgi:hypothetical protein
VATPALEADGPLAVAAEDGAYAMASRHRSTTLLKTAGSMLPVLTLLPPSVEDAKPRVVNPRVVEIERVTAAFAIDLELRGV